MRQTRCLAHLDPMFEGGDDYVCSACTRLISETALLDELTAQAIEYQTYREDNPVDFTNLLN